MKGHLPISFEAIFIGAFSSSPHPGRLIGVEWLGANQAHELNLRAFM